MNSLDELVADLAMAVDWRGHYRDDPQWDSFWPKLESRMGYEFPADFKAYVESFPPGDIGPLYALHPLDGSGDVDDRISTYASRVEDFHWSLNDFAGRVEGFPFRFGSNDGELLVWGSVQSDHVLCWEVNNADPSKWTSAVCATPGLSEWITYPKGMVELLIDLAREESGIEILADIYFEPLKFYPAPGAS